MEKQVDNPFQHRIFRYLASGKVHSGILLSGSDTQENLKLAIRMAAFLFCNNRINNSAPCLTCSTCSRITKNLHPDVILVQEESDTIKIDAVREVCHQVMVAPIEASQKICIIEDIHKMNAASANAFLKTLEEPGQDRFFILTTSKLGALLPTIISRCLLFHLPPPREEFSLSAEKLTQHENSLNEVLSSQNTKPLTTKLSDKEHAMEFLQFLQLRIRNQLVNQQSTIVEKASPFDLLNLYDESLEAEGKLRTNASPPLLMDCFIKNSLLVFA